MIPSRVLAQHEVGDLVAETAKVNTEDAIPVEPGKTEVELTYQYTEADQAYDANNDRSDIQGNREHKLNLKITHGFTENLDGSASFGWADLRNLDSDPQRGEGFGDLSLNMKWRFFANEKYGLHFAYVPGITVPIGDATTTTELGPSQDYWGLDQQFVVTTIGGMFTGSFDVGYSLPFGEDRADARGSLTANMALGYHVANWLHPEVELNYGHDFFDKADDSEFLAVTIGAILKSSDALRLDVGVQQVFYGENTDQSTVATMNLSVTF